MGYYEEWSSLVNVKETSWKLLGIVGNCKELLRDLFDNGLIGRIVLIWNTSIM